jgi:hypothetical protein
MMHDPVGPWLAAAATQAIEGATSRANPVHQDRSREEEETKKRATGSSVVTDSDKGSL